MVKGKTTGRLKKSGKNSSIASFTIKDKYGLSRSYRRGPNGELSYKDGSFIKIISKDKNSFDTAYKKS